MRKLVALAIVGLLSSNYAVASKGACPNVSYYTAFKEGDSLYKTVFRLDECKNLVEESHNSRGHTGRPNIIHQIDGKVHETYRDVDSDGKLWVNTEKYSWDLENQVLMLDFRIVRSVGSQMTSYSYTTTTFARNGNEVLATRKNESGVLTKAGWEVDTSTRFQSYNALDEK